ncbi:glycosyltransferase family 9 protein [Halomonas sp. MCCC 1A17488]|uniref:glycosyltransferase family 9 protein n=1 Tax=unclassified Halomonas TaxID=2609666 RepID=UPI0018D2395E|nr:MULTISPECIES: glycosyltransferase family 9 protein [unclassified Halomonas]MCE8016184.1 glycosyltransferase family 9 protein [Halomonas sp. MCCC 1A17488]MCG3239517.1 glycosyltransferase family 9 protein [Halomonas sp. MCCC 1A17488]QPP50562.1 glycosyltransferase family 9 protein [Halomonas sp. SS10-MC5]
MFLLTSIRRHPAMRKLGKRLERGAKAWLYRALTKHARAGRPATPETLLGARRILLVRPNFRIGNAVIGARLIQALTQQRSEIELDYLGTDATQTLFVGMPLAHYYSLSRSMVLRPWRLWRLLIELRRREYDLAVQVGEGSLTSWLFVQLCGARQKMGQCGRLQATYDWVAGPAPARAHALANSLAAPLGLACEPRPWLVLSPQEHDAALALLARQSLPPSAIGIFVGGHLDKRLPLPFWQALLRALEARCQPYLVLLGPEEARHLPALASACGVHGRLLPPLPLREFAAVLSQLPRLVTPDTGPMHMAAALAVPVVALLNVPGSRRFAPEGPADLVLFQPDPETVAERVSHRQEAARPAPQPSREAHGHAAPAHPGHDDRRRDRLHAHPAGGG